MKTVLIHGQNHRGSTYHIASNLAEKIGGQVKEFFLPKDFGEFCIGCTRCFMESEKLCPHYESLRPIIEAMDEADVIILASPVYVFHATGSMKAFLDHLAYRWMVHRPEEGMFSKQAVCISTAAGGGMKSANKDMAHSFFFWGVGKIYKYGKAVQATGWKQVSPKKKQKIDQDLTSMAARIKKRHGKVRPGIKTKALFYLMRLLQKRGLNRADRLYWEEKGWLAGTRPWNS